MRDAVVADLIERKTPRVLRDLPDKGEGWTVHYALFGRSGFTDPARSAAADRDAMLLTLDQIERDLMDS